MIIQMKLSIAAKFYSIQIAIYLVDAPGFIMFIRTVRLLLMRALSLSAPSHLL